MANITIDTSAELNLDMEAMTATTKARYDEFNNRYKQILENDNALNGIVDDAVKKLNDDMSALNTNIGNSLTDLQNALNDKLTKMNRVTTVTFLIDNWVGDSAPYTNTVELTNATGADDENPEIYMAIPDTVDADSAEGYVEAFGYITKYETGVGTITATAMYEKPKANVAVSVKGV